MSQEDRAVNLPCNKGWMTLYAPCSMGGRRTWSPIEPLRVLQETPYILPV